MQASDDTKVLYVGDTNYTFATFDNLQAATKYEVRVFLVTSGGRDPSHYLAINISTAATGNKVFRKCNNLIHCTYMVYCCPVYRVV